MMIGVRIDAKGEIIGIDMVVFKHMHGNMVQQFSKLKRFCDDNGDSIYNECEDVKLWIKQQNNLIS